MNVGSRCDQCDQDAPTCPDCILCGDCCAHNHSQRYYLDAVDEIQENEAIVSHPTPWRVNPAVEAAYEAWFALNLRVTKVNGGGRVASDAVIWVHENRAELGLADPDVMLGTAAYWTLLADRLTLLADEEELVY